jgi:eukaryotic-like serine/threonine-protein kinase
MAETPKDSSGPASFAGGRFGIESRLGEGGMGVVYRAYDRELDARVAIKTLRKLDAGAIYRFKREFRALADISHRNLVSLHELVSDDQAWFFTMELVDGVDFLTWVRNFDPEATIRDDAPRFDEGRLRSALKELAEGIDVLHANGRFHRDIKPSNVLVTREGRVVVLDFGLVTMVAEESADPEMMTNHVVGTIGYMAPEQAAGMPVTPASDWYSVGVILFEALTNERPFTGKPFDILAAKQNKDAPRASATAPGVPKDLDDLCFELLQRNPRKRPDAASISKRLGATPPRARVRKSDEPPLVGREAHLRALDDAFRAMKGGRTVIAYVRGSSGMGKSVLVRGFIDELLDREGPLVLSGRCYERESVPYKAFDTVVDALCRHLMRLPKEEVEALLTDDVLHLSRMFPVLWRVRAIREASKVDPKRSEARDPLEHRRRAFRALRALFDRLAARRQVIVYIDDLQWSDLDSASLIAELFRPPSPPPVLLIGCYRSEDVETSAALRAILAERHEGAVEVHEIAIEPLADRDALALVDALSSAADPSAVIDRRAIVEDAEGNPFVLDELVRHALRSGASSPASDREISYEEALLARLSRLDDRARALLDLVSVSGRPILQRVALRAVEGGGDNQAALVMLLTERLIRTRIFGEEEALEAYHDRIRETVVRRASKDRLERNHRALIRALEALESPDHEALVEHLIAVGEKNRAADHAAIAAVKAAEALAFDRAVTLYRIALAPEKLDAEARVERSSGLGDALANGGRGREAASAYLEGAAFARAADRALDLRRRAAEQLLRSGHIDEGTEVLDVVLEAVGMELAPTPKRALASLALRRMQVRLRGLRFTPRAERDVPPTELAKIDVLWSVSIGLAMVETVRGSDFQARHLLLALEAGEPHRIARALAMEAAYSATGGGPSKARTEDLISRSGALAKELCDPHALGLSRYAAGVAAFLSGRFSEARASSSAAEAIFREKCRGVAWELASAGVFHLWSVGILGDLREFVRMVDEGHREAEERGDRYALANYRMGLANLRWLIADDPEGARRQIGEAMNGWSQRGFQIQHYYQLIAENGLDLYSGRGEPAHARALERWADLERSQLLMVQFIRVDALATRARAAIARAKAGGKRAEALLASAERDARRIAREKMAWSDPIAKKLLGGIAAQRGEREAAASLYLEATDGFDRAEMALYAAVARHRAGEHAGGTRGQDLRGRAERWLAAQRVQRPLQIISMIAP